MDLIWDWLSKNIEPAELTPSGQHVLQEIRNIWQQQNRDHLAEWERNILSQSQAPRQVSSTKLWTLQEIKPIENHQPDHHVRNNDVSQYEDCGSSASDNVTEYSPAGKLDTREELFGTCSPSEQTDADEGLHLSLAASPVWPPMSCDIFSDCGAPATEDSLSPMEVEAEPVFPVIIPETHEELSSPDYQPEGLPTISNGLRGFVASGNISREEIDDINSMFAGGDEFFQDILEYEDKETRPTFGNEVENEVVHTSIYFRQCQEQSIGSFDLGTDVPFKNETLMCEKEISSANIVPSLTPLSSEINDNGVEVFKDTRIEHITISGESLPSVSTSDIQNDALSDPLNKKFISSVIKPVQQSNSLFQLPMKEGTSKGMVQPVKNTTCAETSSAHPVQQSESLFLLPMREGTSKGMLQSVKNISCAETSNTHPVQQSESLFQLPMKECISKGMVQPVKNITSAETSNAHPVQQSESLFLLPMREGTSKDMVQSVKNISCAETSNTHPVQQSESLFQLPMKEGTSKDMVQSVKNISCAETSNAYPVQQSESLFHLPMKKRLPNYVAKFEKNMLCTETFDPESFQQSESSFQLPIRKCETKSVKNIPSLERFNPGESYCNNKKSSKDTATHLKTRTIPEMFAQKKKREIKTIAKESSPQRKKCKYSDPCSKIIDKMESDEGNCNKNMQKFKVPFKKENSGIKESNSVDIKSEISSDIKCHITVLNQNSLPLLEKKLANEKLLEIGLTVTYRNGFCQLNQCVDRCKFLSCTPTGIMISLKADDIKPEYLYFSLDVSHWNDLQLPRTLISQILKCHCRKICFKAQEIMVVLIKIFRLHRKQVSMDMILLDSMVGCWLLDPDHPVYDFSAVKAVLGFNKNKTLSNDPQTKVCQLLQQLSKVMELLYQKLDENGLWRLFVNMEMKIIPILADMECHGIRVERKRLEEMGDSLKASLKILQESAYKIVGKQFQLNSTLQLRKILYEDLKLDEKHHIKVKETNTTGAKSTSEPMLQLLKPLHPLPGIILEYRHLQKVKSTYVEAILQHINGDHIFSTWELTSAATGRITSSNPNLQALPKQPISVSGNNTNLLLLRSPYLPHKDFTFVAADFQHIELRVFAHFSQDPTLLTIFQQPGDIFYILAQKWLHKSEQPIGIEEREKTKRIVYSVMYGAGPSKLAEFLHIDRSEANQIINSFINHFPSLRTFSRRMTELCREKGRLQTISGRHRLFPNICSSNPVVRAHTERQAINFVIQGSAADICKAFMLHTEHLLSSLPQIEAHLVLQVHDELVWEVKDVQVDTFRDMIQGVLEDTSFLCKYIGNFSVPLSVTITMGRDLANMKIDLLSQNFYSLRSQ